MSGPRIPSRDFEIPVDELAERMLTAVAVGSVDGARLAASRVKPAELYSRTLRRIFEAALTLDDVHAEQDRILEVSLLTEVPMSEIARLVDERADLIDSGGRWAGRVRRAARRRWAQGWAEKILIGAADAQPVELTQAARMALDNLVRLEAEGPGLAVVAS